MIRFFLLTAFLICAPIAVSPALAQTDALPAIGADGMIAPLTVDQLTAQEQATFASLVPGSADARQFLYTRGFLRYCQRVVAGAMPAAQLPDLPDEQNWNRRFLSQDEAANIVDVALGRQIAASVDPNAQLPHARPATATLPAVDANGMIAPLAVAQLDSAERATYATLAGDDARRFLYTRGFLRFCRLVVANQLDPQQLPELPARENWDRRFISEEDGHNILDVALGMQMMAMMRPPP